MRRYPTFQKHIIKQSRLLQLRQLHFRKQFGFIINHIPQTATNLWAIKRLPCHFTIYTVEYTLVLIHNVCT
jgi:hypothetical protein